jgi:hypothetical protein
LRLVWLVDAAAELGVSVEALIDRLIAGDLPAIGCEYGDLPKSIPPEHFAVQLREQRAIGPDDRAALSQLGYTIPSWYAGIEWVDTDYDGRTGPPLLMVRRATCLDVEGCAIFEGGEPRWTDIQIKLESGRAAASRKTVGDDAYKSHQQQTKANTGHWSSSAQDTAWANENGYSRDSVRAARTKFKKTLSAAERAKFEKPGPRN